MKFPQEPFRKAARKYLLPVVLGSSLSGCIPHIYNVAGENKALAIHSPLAGEIGQTNRDAQLLRDSGIVANSRPGNC